jgi:hypothetical protein
MRIRFVVVLDRGHVRIYSEDQEPGWPKPVLRIEGAFDLVNGHASHTGRLAEKAGRFSGAHGPGGAPERLTMSEEEDRRVAEELARLINGFFHDTPGEPWDIAAPPVLCHMVLDRIEATHRSQLRRTVQKDLVKVPTASLKSHFVG